MILVSKMIRFDVTRLGIVAAFLAALILGGCVTQPLPGYQISLENQVTLEKLARGVRYSTLSVNAPLHADASVRAYSAITPPGGWSAFLEDGLKQELTSAQHYEKSSDKSIEVTVVKLKFQDGTAELAARFVVRQGSASVYDKVLGVKKTWQSSFVGTLAVRDAISQYGAIFQQLQRQLFEDADFVKLT